MRSLSSTIKCKISRQISCRVRIILLLIVCGAIQYTQAAAQSVAIITPDKTDSSRQFASALEDKFPGGVRVLDESLSSSAFNSITLERPFNLTVDESKRIGAAIGCDFFILVRSSTQRRSASRRPEYYESSAAVYTVSARTGRLVFFRLLQFDAARSVDSMALLDRSAPSLASEIEGRLRSSARSELNESPRPQIEEIRDPESVSTKDFRPPIPYKRIKPEYTAEAGYHDVTATIDIEVDLDAAGTITRTEIVRWGGFGLDESVEKAVRQMNWRPGQRGSKTLPMRFLVRYNFKKVDK